MELRERDVRKKRGNYGVNSEVVGGLDMPLDEEERYYCSAEV